MFSVICQINNKDIFSFKQVYERFLIFMFLIFLTGGLINLLNTAYDIKVTVANLHSDYIRQDLHSGKSFVYIVIQSTTNKMKECMTIWVTFCKHNEILSKLGVWSYDVLRVLVGFFCFFNI